MSTGIIVVSNDARAFEMTRYGGVIPPKLLPASVLEVDDTNTLELKVDAARIWKEEC
jgi:hypothetical protein